jgi:hypothetical protein
MVNKYLAVKASLALMVSALVMLTVINLLKDRLDTEGIIINFLVFYVFVSAALYIPIMLIVGDAAKSLRIDLGLTMLHAAFDTWLPPYVLDIHGTILQSTAIGYTGSIDYLFATIGQAFGLGGLLLYLFTYGLMPMLLLVVAGLFIGANKYLKELAHL